MLKLIAAVGCLLLVVACSTGDSTLAGASGGQAGDGSGAASGSGGLGRADGGGMLSAEAGGRNGQAGSGVAASHRGGGGSGGSPAGAGGLVGGGGAGAVGGASGSAGAAGGGGTAGASAAPAGAASVALPQLGTPLTPGDVADVGVTLEVRTDQPLRWIAPEIYGTNGAPDIGKNHQTVVRSGGNRMTAYNWENNASNAGSDWKFQNDDFLSKSDEPAKPILDGIAEATAHDAAAIVTISLVDYVAADKKGDGDVRNSGADYLQTRFKQNKAQKGNSFGMPDTQDAYVYQDEFVAYLKQRVPQGSRLLFSMDNEPDLWSHTHAEVHPDPVTYAELWERNQRYASAVKQVWPEAAVLGFVSYGFNGYVSLQNASDANNRNFIEWYLDQAHAEEMQHGKRLIDYLDLHWYPEAQGGGTRITEASNADAVVQAREQAPRSLWDDTYNEQSWIHDSLGGPIRLLPWLQDKVDAHYPETKLAFSEWNYGGGDHISGAIACADVLGIFGRYGVGLATYWDLHSDESFAHVALRAYRNYDAASGTFGDVSLAATSSDIEHVTVYASLHADDPQHVVIVAINKDSKDARVGLKLAHPHGYASLKRFVITAASADIKPQDAVMTSAMNAWKLTLPAQSVSVLVPQP